MDLESNNKASPEFFGLALLLQHLFIGQSNRRR